MRPLRVGSLALLVALFTGASARAEFTAPALLSGTQQLQFDQANAPVLSADGHYAVFQGSLAGVSGVYRRDLQTGAIEPVAISQSPESTEAPRSAQDATAPSVSADGRYIAFTTTADLSSAEPAADLGCPEVYVRDMQASGPGAFTLVAALNGTETGITYQGSCVSRTEGFALAGAQAAPAVAMSADGREVAFTILSQSNLMPGAPTPPSQVVMRDLATMTTTLVSATPAGQAPAGGGAFPSTDSENEAGARNVGSGLQQSYADQLTASTAALSADGSTVAWLGTHVPAQVPGATDVEVGMSGDLRVSGRDPVGDEAEPLWRRVADGPGAVTRRLLAGAGLDFYFESAATESGNPVLGGSFVGEQSLLFIPPVLSADGRTAAVLANAPPPVAEPSIEAEASPAAPNTDAYVVHVDDDPADPPVVTPITTTPDYAVGSAAIGNVKDLAISSDGTRVAFDTTRTQFTLPSTTLISPPVSYANVAETYVANLALGTLQRATATYDGSTPNGWSGLLSFAEGGTTLAFASQATNLLYGDSIPASQVYLIGELPASMQVAPQLFGPTPTLVLPSAQWLLSATATPQRDGSVLVEIEVPGAGRLTVRATAQLPAKAASKRASDRAAAKTGKRRGNAHRRAAASKSKTSAIDVVKTETVASTVVRATAPGELKLRLRVQTPYRTLLTASGGLYSLLRVSFTATSHPALSETIPVSFHAAKPAPKSRRAKAKRLAAGGSSEDAPTRRTPATRVHR